MDNEFIIAKSRRKGSSWSKFMYRFWYIHNLPKPLLLPIVAKSAFEDDFKDTLNAAQLRYYYPQQCAMKHMYGTKSTIKFID